MFSKVLITYLNNVVNKYDSDTHKGASGISFLITSESGGSYATLLSDKKGNIRYDSYVKLGDSKDFVRVLNLININKEELDVSESWRFDDLKDRKEMGSSAGIMSKLSYGTLSTFLNIVLHEVTHAVNFHVSNEQFDALINVYLSNKVNAGSLSSMINETYPEGLPISLITDRFRKSREVFYLYGYNLYVRSWAEVEAGSAGFTANMLTGLFMSKVLFYLVSSLSDMNKNKHNLIKKFYSSDPVAYLYDKLFSYVIGSQDNPDYKDFIKEVKHGLYDVLVSKLRSGNLSGVGNVYFSNNHPASLLDLANKINIAFPQNYGFFKAMKFLFGTNSNRGLEDFIVLLAHGVANDVCYHVVRRSYDSSEQSFFRNTVLEFRKIYNSDPDNVDGLLRDRLLEFVQKVLLKAASDVLYDLHGDMMVGADYTAGWITNMRYDDIVKISNNIDNIYTAMIDAKKESKFRDNDLKFIYNNLINVLYTNEAKSPSYDVIKNFLTALYGYIGAGTRYFPAVLEGGGPHVAVRSLALSSHNIVSVNTYTEVYPIAGSKQSNQAMLNAVNTFSLETPNESIFESLNIQGLTNMSQGLSSSIINRSYMKYTGSIFSLIGFLSLSAAKWQYRLIEEVNIPDVYNKLYSAISSKDNVLLKVSNLFKNFIEKYTNIVLSMRIMYSEQIKSVLSGVYSGGVRNVSAVDSLLDYIYPANFSDIVLFYKGAGAQMRLLEVLFEFFMRVFNDNLYPIKQSLKSYIEQKLDILKKMSELYSSSSKIYETDKHKIFNEYLKKLDSIDKTISEILSILSERFMLDLYEDDLLLIYKMRGDQEEQEQEQEEPLTPEEIKKLVTMMIMSDAPLSTIFEDYYKLFTSSSRSVYNDLFDKYGMSDEDMEEVYKEQKEEIDQKIQDYMGIISSIPSIDRYKAMSLSDRNKLIYDLTQRYTEYAQDIQDIFSFIDRQIK